jgi:CBS domain-containing protein
MSAPVIVTVNRSVAEIQLLMMQHNIGHLCVTSDGTSESEIIGIISEHDVLPLIITRGTCKTDKRAQTPLELKAIRENLTKLIVNALYENIPIAHICQIVERSIRPLQNEQLNYLF